MALLDLLGRRWVLRILWELREEPAATFRDLQARCGNVSSSVLNQRLSELREAGIIASGQSERLRAHRTRHNLLHTLAPIDDWAARWGRRQAGSAALHGKLQTASNSPLPVLGGKSAG